eukprot:1152809-Pelagomonas_calceolata.AAC.10
MMQLWSPSDVHNPLHFLPPAHTGYCAADEGSKIGKAARLSLEYSPSKYRLLLRTLGLAKFDIAMQLYPALAKHLLLQLSCPCRQEALWTPDVYTPSIDFGEVSNTMKLPISTLSSMSRTCYSSAALVGASRLLELLLQDPEDMVTLIP